MNVSHCTSHKEKSIEEITKNIYVRFVLLATLLLSALSCVSDTTYNTMAMLMIMYLLDSL